MGFRNSSLPCWTQGVDGHCDIAGRKLKSSAPLAPLAPLAHACHVRCSYRQQDGTVTGIRHRASGTIGTSGIIGAPSTVRPWEGGGEEMKSSAPCTFVARATRATRATPSTRATRPVDEGSEWSR